MITNEQLLEMLDTGLQSDDYEDLPTRMLPGLYGYVIHGIPPGDFLTAVITNDLVGAIVLADDQNLSMLPIWVKFFCSCVEPTGASGSLAKMNRWILSRRQG